MSQPQATSHRGYHHRLGALASQQRSKVALRDSLVESDYGAFRGVSRSFATQNPKKTVRLVMEPLGRVEEIENGKCRIAFGAKIPEVSLEKKRR